MFIREENLEDLVKEGITGGYKMGHNRDYEPEVTIRRVDNVFDDMTSLGQGCEIYEAECEDKRGNTYTARDDSEEGARELVLEKYRAGLEEIAEEEENEERE